MGEGKVARAAIGLYSTARRSGLLDTAAGRRIFSAAYFLYKQHFEDPLAGLARRNPGLFRGGDALDIGANIGYTACALAPAINRDARVIAFEPEPFNFKLLCETAASERSKGKITAIQAAVGSADGVIELALNEGHHGDHRVLTSAFRAHAKAWPVIRVPQVSIDSFLQERQPARQIGFIKIDVQGFEHQVCLGMERTLRTNHQAVICLEYMPSALEALGESASLLLTLLRAHGFHIATLHHDGLTSAGIDDETLNSRGYVDLLCARR